MRNFNELDSFEPKLFAICSSSDQLLRLPRGSSFSGNADVAFRSHARLGTKLPKLVGQSTSALPGNSDINLFCYGQGVINLDAEVSDGAFDLGMAEQELHGPQVASAPVDQGRFGPSE